MVKPTSVRHTRPRGCDRRWRRATAGRPELACSRNLSEPPGRRTRWTSRSVPGTSGTVHILAMPPAEAVGVSEARTPRGHRLSVCIRGGFISAKSFRSVESDPDDATPAADGPGRMPYTG